jgi:hypothetical protein
VNESSGAPVATGAWFPELLGAPEPAPPMPSGRSRLLRTLARIVLWSLVAVGALRGLMPSPVAGPDATAAGASPEDRRAEAVAAAFMREYLTVGGDQAARAERLSRFTVAGVHLRGSVSVPAGVAQYADLVVAAGSSPVDGGIEVTVLAHVLQLRSGTYRDSGLLAFAVPLAVGREGVAVSGRPRPTVPPVASEPMLGRPRAAPAELSPAARRLVRQAVIAFIATDAATLARLGGGRAPSTRPLPSGWRATSVGGAEVAGPSTGLTAHVPVRARPPTGQATYVVPVRVHLHAGPAGLTVRHIDGGGSA